MTARALPTSALRGLADKYVGLMSLRHQQDNAGRRGVVRFEGDERAARRRAQRRLSAAWPGCLRELQRLDMRRLRRRSVEVARALQQPRPGVAPCLWMRLMLDYHRLLRVCRQCPGGKAHTASRRSLTVRQGLAVRYGLTLAGVERLLWAEDR